VDGIDQWGVSGEQQPRRRWRAGMDWFEWLLSQGGKECAQPCPGTTALVAIEPPLPAFAAALPGQFSQDH